MSECKIHEILLFEGGKDLKELAAKAKVSVNTVSKFANNKPVSKKSIARIIDGLNELATKRSYNRDDLYNFKI